MSSAAETVYLWFQSLKMGVPEYIYSLVNSAYMATVSLPETFAILLAMAAEDGAIIGSRFVPTDGNRFLFTSLRAGHTKRQALQNCASDLTAELQRLRLLPLSGRRMEVLQRRISAQRLSISSVLPRSPALSSLQGTSGYSKLESHTPSGDGELALDNDVLMARPPPGRNGVYNNAKQELERWVQKIYGTVRYETVSAGPSHQPWYTTTCQVETPRVSFTTTGRSETRKGAEKAAGEAALTELGRVGRGSHKTDPDHPAPQPAASGSEDDGDVSMWPEQPLRITPNLPPIPPPPTAAPAVLPVVRNFPPVAVTLRVGGEKITVKEKTYAKLTLGEEAQLGDDGCIELEEDPRLFKVLLEYVLDRAVRLHKFDVSSLEILRSMSERYGVSQLSSAIDALESQSTPSGV